MFNIQIIHILNESNFFFRVSFKKRKKYNKVFISTKLSVELPVSILQILNVGPNKEQIDEVGFGQIQHYCLQETKKLLLKFYFLIYYYLI